MGRSVTHKRQTCYKMIIDGKYVAETARETNHSPEATTRYVKDCKRILACVHKGLTPKETAFVVKGSEKLVFEYVNLIQENQVDINGQIGQDGCDPRIAGMFVAIASLNTFMLPTHQVNALIIQSGGYKTTDYMRVGSGMMLLFLMILMGILFLFY